MELFPLFGVKSGKSHFPCALDDEKGSDRALAPRKGMPFRYAFFVKIGFSTKLHNISENIIPQKVFSFPQKGNDYDEKSCLRESCSEPYKRNGFWGVFLLGIAKMLISHF